MSTSFHLVSDLVADTIKAELGPKYHYTLVASGAYVGTLTSQAVLTKVDGKCSVQLPAVSQPLTGATLVLTGIPVNQAPAVAQTLPIVINNNGALAPGSAVVATTGVITISTVAGAAFTPGAGGLPSTTLTWVCA